MSINKIFQNLCKKTKLVCDGKKSIPKTSLVFLVSLFLFVTSNVLFFEKLFAVYELSPFNILAILSLSSFILLLIFIVLMLLCVWRFTKMIIVMILLISSFVTYFGSTYDIVISKDMILNSFHTDYAEAMDLLTGTLLLSIFVLGILPSILVCKVRITKESFCRGFLVNIKYIGGAFVIMVLLLFSFSDFYTFFLKEHKSVRLYVNPLAWIYNSSNLAIESLRDRNDVIQVMGKDAKIMRKNPAEKKRVVIMVVGEALRSDRLPFNGYQRDTMPLTRKENILNFSKMYSCGTSTAVSVPCMFSMLGRSNYTHTKGVYTENVIDILSHTGGVNIVWRDNNSSSKGVADRVKYESFRYSKSGRESRDESMLDGLDRYVEKSKNKDVFIVLHQIGNHGPAYYKRYPKEFERYKPVCRKNILNECEKEEVGNAYDNAVLYTDYFLYKTIEFLKKYNQSHDVAMIYMSDHGESLGENGVYLHGLPYFMAPDAQKHIASLMWLGSGFEKNIDTSILASYKDEDFSHDNLPHTILGLFDVETKVYDPKKDILYRAQK